MDLSPSPLPSCFEALSDMVRRCLGGGAAGSAMLRWGSDIARAERLPETLSVILVT